MGFSDAGQLGPIIRWGDGSVDDPTSVLVVCDQCAAAVLMTMTATHAATHNPTDGTS